MFLRRAFALIENVEIAQYDLRLDPSLAHRLPFALPTEPTAVVETPGVDAMWLGPDEWLVVTGAEGIDVTRGGITVYDGAGDRVPVGRLRQPEPERLILPIRADLDDGSQPFEGLFVSGVVGTGLSEMVGQLAERVRRWANWFRDELRRGRTEAELIPDFAAYEANDIRASGAAEGRVADYETADPSFMAVAASIRYWSKYHPEAVPDLA